MNALWISVASVLSSIPVFSDLPVAKSHLRVFPRWNSSIAGVFQVSYLDDLGQVQYSFTASEARLLCSSLGAGIASRANVERGLAKGLETCRFGWTDENIVVIPRIAALPHCGKNGTGLVKWRAPVTEKFDAFCFNESAAHPEEDTTILSTTILSTVPTSSPTPSSPLAVNSSVITLSFPENINSEVRGGVDSTPSSGGVSAKTALIASTCALLIITIITLAYIKLKRSSRSGAMKQQTEMATTENWTSVTAIKGTEEVTQEDEGPGVGDAASGAADIRMKTQPADE